MEDRASSAFARIESSLAPRKSRNARTTTEGPPSCRATIRSNIGLAQAERISHHSTEDCSRRQVRWLCLPLLQPTRGLLHRIRLVLNPRRKTLSSARSNNCDENTRSSLPVKKYESFIRKVRKPNLVNSNFHDRGRTATRRSRSNTLDCRFLLRSSERVRVMATSNRPLSYAWSSSTG